MNPRITTINYLTKKLAEYDPQSQEYIQTFDMLNSILMKEPASSAVPSPSLPNAPALSNPAPYNYPPVPYPPVPYPPVPYPPVGPSYQPVAPIPPVHSMPPMTTPQTVSSSKENSVPKSQKIQPTKRSLPLLVGLNDPLLMESLKNHLMCRFELIASFMQHQYWFKRLGGNYSPDMNLLKKDSLKPEELLGILIYDPKKLEFHPLAKKYPQRFNEYLFKKAESFDLMHSIYLEAGSKKIDVIIYNTQLKDFFHSQKNRKYLLDLKIVKKDNKNQVSKAKSTSSEIQSETSEKLDVKSESSATDSDNSLKLSDTQYHKVDMIFNKWHEILQAIAIQVIHQMYKENLIEKYSDYILKDDLYINTFPKYTNKIVTEYKKKQEVAAAKNVVQEQATVISDNNNSNNDIPNVNDHNK